ncbi:hypothetical protein PR202_ga07744 [Eleusine coracana subsp. coracana]|uniref:Vacuolar protein sorting-associated protein 54 N-terminal domain-containing protein n=1 Tax=Eleusine coracana subsp. coracana TaxID=191504 RepID=A0AAV5BY93_ELECO|nr:hypothetical protein PR202_ga07744 [Eleusine coracana subsp. coracana]
MRRDAPPPTAPSASSSSSSSLFGGEQLFEAGPSPLVFLPLLLIQGGGMDLSRVGEKLLSSVRSARSLGLLPPTPSAPPPRPEVPERAAAAAAAARAIAGLPPHERINLPSNSEDLVSIYGSNPQGEPVEELEEVFYEEEFDAIKYILENIPDEDGDATYFDKQSTLRLAQLDKIAERLSHHVMGHHEEMELRLALDMQMELETFVEKENYFQDLGGSGRWLDRLVGSRAAYAGGGDGWAGWWEMMPRRLPQHGFGGIGDLLPFQGSRKNIESNGPDLADKNNTSQRSNETLVDSGRGHSSVTVVQDSSATELSDRTPSSEVSNPDVSTSGMDSPFYQLRTDAAKLVGNTFERGRRNLWQLATSRLSVLLSSSAVCSTSTYQFLKNYEDITIFILAGEAFCGFEASEFRQKLKTVCLNYVMSFHRQNLYALKMVLEKESWTIMSAEASQIISLAGLTGDGAALISPNGSNSNLPINHYHGKSIMTDSGKPKNGFASWLKIENPFSSKLENGSAESPKSNMLFDSSAGNRHGSGNNSSFDEENEDLLADFIDEDSQLPSRIPKPKIVKGNSSNWKDGDISSQTGSSLSLLSLAQSSFIKNHTRLRSMDKTTESFIFTFITIVNEFNIHSAGCDAYRASQFNAHFLWVKDFFRTLVDSVPDLAEYIHRTSARMLLHIDGYPDKIANAKWEVKELGIEHNGYVDLLLGEFKHYKTRLDHGGISKELQHLLLQYGIESIAEVLVEGLSRVKRNLAFIHEANGTEEIITASMFFQEYSKSQVVGLVNLVATMKGWKRKTRLETVEKIEAGP